ncbi:MAG: tetratricopeptide repeat protein, partial [Chloroflexota bacterium]
MIRQLLGRFLQLCGENVHLVISSRNLPDLPVSPLLIARNQAGGISFEDLSFQVDEIQTLFRQNRGLEITNEEAQSILRDTEGWVAAIHLSNGISTNLPNFRPLHSTTALFDFFSREVMQRQSDDVRRFMYMTSIFDAFDIALCERVLSPLLTETSLDYSTLFRQVQSAADIFSVPLDQDGNWIRYHHLFQHFLRSQLQYEEPVLAWSIQQKLAQVYEQDQKFEEALQIYERLNDYQNQIRLLISTGADFIGAGRILTLDTWLRKIPVELAYAQPALLSLMGAVHTTQGDQRQARQLLDVAEQQQKETSDKLEWFKTLVRRAEVFRQLGQFQDALLDVDQITEIEGEEKDVRALIIYAEVRRVRGLALFGLGRANEALAWLEESLQRYRQLGQDQQIPILETELGVIHRRLGDVGAAARYYANALAGLEHSGNSGWKARLLNNMGMLKYMTGQMEEAYHLLQESVQTAKLSGYIRIQTNALISLGDLLCDINDLDNAFNYYDLALTQATELGHSLYIFYASLGEVRLKRLHGDAIAALTELRQVELSQIKLGSFERAFFNLERGLCLLDAKREVEALAAFRLASDLFLEGGNQAEGKIAQLWIAAALSFSDTRSAIAEMRKLLPPQREWTISTPFMLHAGRASRFLKLTGQTRLLRDVDLRVFFEHAVRMQDSLSILSKETSVLDGSSTSRQPRLEIRTFGHIQVFNNGKALELSDWQTREARDLFIYLLQSPPRTKEEIAIDFWPDLPPA